MLTKAGMETGSQSTACSAADGIQGLPDRFRLKTREAVKSCHNCGLPNWAISGPGVEIRLRLKAEGPYHHRDRRA